MGAVDCKQGDVLYLALEDNLRRLKDRLLTLCPTRKLQGVNLDRLTVRTVAPRIDTGLMAELDKWRQASTNPRIVIIDVFLKVRPPRKKGEDDAYAADYEAVRRALPAPLECTGCSGYTSHNSTPQAHAEC